MLAWSKYWWLAFNIKSPILKSTDINNHTLIWKHVCVKMASTCQCKIHQTSFFTYFTKHSSRQHFILYGSQEWCNKWVLLVGITNLLKCNNICGVLAYLDFGIHFCFWCDSTPYMYMVYMLTIWCAIET